MEYILSKLVQMMAVYYTLIMNCNPGRDTKKSKGCTGDSCKLVYDKARALQ